MKVYEALRSLSDKYTVFYSLSWVGINDSRTIGEADFVILHPDKGILVIEVKSGEIEYKNGEWIQTNTRSRVAKRIDPLGQARKSQFELLDRLYKADINFSHPMMCYCAWFPSVEIPAGMPLPIEATKEILLDKRSLDNPEKAIDSCFAYWETKYRPVRLKQKQFQTIIDILCPHFHVVPKLKTKLEEMEASYIQLTNQQAALLDFLAEQRTAVIHGLAGTGKTVLAVEKAKRLASQNESVLFLCYNNFLRDMLKNNNSIPNVTFHNAHSLAFEIMGSSDAPIEEVLTEFEEFLEEVFDEESWHYGNIIVDEGQDLDDRLLNRLYELVKKKNGCFYVFYDRNQYIMKNQLPQWIEAAECRLVLHKELRSCDMVMERVEQVRKARLASPAATTRRTANTPTLFAVDAQPDTDYLIIPQVSSERRRYIPIGFMTPDVIASNLVFVVPDATLYHFGILTSNVHNAWMRTTCGRMKSDYRYGGDIVYNNFPWPKPTDEQKAKIEQTAQVILDARALYPDASLADLYDELTMPPELRKAHQANDKAVMAAYGFPIKNFTESDCVAALMKLYQELTAKEVN